MRCAKSRGLRVLLFGLTAGVALEAGAQALAEGYGPPRHDAAPRLARSEASAMLAPLDPLCGTTVSGVLVLDREVFCGDEALYLGAAATLDLNGFGFEGSILAQSGATLRNGTILGGPLDFSGCEDCLIEDVHVRDGSDFTLQAGPRNVIRRSRFTGNYVAVDIYYGDDPREVAVVDCVFEDNAYGVNVAKGSRHLVASNTFRDNGVGVSLSNEDATADPVLVNDNTVSGNVFEGNRWGAVIEPPICDAPDCFEGNAFLHNVVVDSLAAGLSLEAFWDELCDSYYDCDLAALRIEDNRFEGNGFGAGVVGGDGLFVSGPPEVTQGIVVARNVALANSDLGIESPGVIDGGANRARDNGNPLQCVGVACELLVDIALKKWDPKLLFHARSHRPIAVVLFGSQSFDVRDVDVRTLAFGPDGAPAERVRKLKTRDENDDGFPDGVFRFRNHETGIGFGDREACLTGETRAGQAFGGCAEISMEAACGLGFELALVLPPLLWIRRSGALRRRNARGGLA